MSALRAYACTRKLNILAGDKSWTVSYRFLQTYNNRLPEFNTRSHTPTLGISRRGSVAGAFGDLPYSAGGLLTYDFISLQNLNKVNKSKGAHSKSFAQRWIVNPYLTLEENPWNMTNLQFRFQWKDFFNDRDVTRTEVRDAKNYMIGLLHFLLFEQGRHYVKLGYQYDVERAEGKNEKIITDCLCGTRCTHAQSPVRTQCHRRTDTLRMYREAHRTDSKPCELLYRLQGRIGWRHSCDSQSQPRA